jgi:hypothetical protein
MKNRPWLLVLFATLCVILPIARALGGTGRIVDGKLDLTVMFTYREAEPDSWRPMFEQASRLLYNATNGQLQIGQVRVVDAGLDKWDADVWIQDNISGAFANVLGLGGPGHIYLSQTHKSVTEPAVGPFGLVHEFGHYGFGLYDEYKGATPPPAAKFAEQMRPNQPHQYCTTEDDTVACVMDGGTTIQPNNRRTEFCTSILDGLLTRHNDGVLVDGQLYVNAQQSLNGESCWETIRRTVGLEAPQSVHTEDPAGLVPIDWEVVPPLDRLAICVDRSESMFRVAERIALAKRTAKSVVGLLHEHKTVDIEGAPIEFAGENLSLISFGYDDSLLFGFREILTSATKDSADAVIDAIGRSPSPGPYTTDIGRALSTALGRIENEGDVPAVSEAILLITDGSHNLGTDPMSVVEALKTRGVRVYCVGIGSDPNADLLSGLAEATGGRYYPVASEEDVAGAAESVAAELRAVGTVQSLEGTLLGQGEHFPMQLDSFAEEVSFVLQWDTGTCDMTLTSPSGDVIDINSADDREDVEASLNWNLLCLRVAHPEGGLWTANVFPQTPDPIHFGLDVFDDNRSVTVNVKAQASNIAYPNPVMLRVDVVAGVPVAGAEVTAVVDRPGGSPVNMTLYDDGVPGHADTFANDGVYGGFFSDYTVSGTYTFHVTARNIDGTGPDPDLPFVEDGPGPPPSIPAFERQASLAVTVTDVAPPIDARLDLHPRTLNRNNTHGKVTAYVELSAPHTVQEIDRATLRLEETVLPLAAPMTVGDHDSNGVADLMVKFERSALLPALGEGMRTPVRLTGHLVTGEIFAALDTIDVIDPHATYPVHLRGPILLSGDTEPIAWTAVPGEPITYDVYLSRDGGLTHERLFSGLADLSIDWTVAGPTTPTAVITVEAWSPEGAILHEQSANFAIATAAGLGEGRTPTAFLGVSPNPVTTAAKLRFSLAGSQEVDLSIFDIQGRRVRRLVSGVQGAGEHVISWDGMGSDDRPVASGIYLYNFRTPGATSNGRMLVVR